MNLQPFFVINYAEIIWLFRNWNVTFLDLFEINIVCKAIEDKDL